MARNESELEDMGAVAENTVVAALAMASQDPRQHGDDVISFVRNDDQTVELLDLERYRWAPRTKRGQISVHTPDGLVTYAQRHVDDKLSTLWADVDGHTITVICNDHANRANAAAWADHRVALTLRRTPEWQAWTALNEKDLDQVRLAEFFEERISDILAPDGATMLEVCQTFHATTGARFKKSIALHSGEQQLVWEEEVDAKAGAGGKTEIPREFTVRLTPFHGAEPVDVTGRFRFRVREGRLTLGFRLLHLDQISRDAIAWIVTNVAERLELDVIEGVAPAARR